MNDHLNNWKQDILAVEIQVWDALVLGDAVADAALLCDDFLGVYSDGFAGKADHVGQLQGGPTVQDYRISETHMTALGADHAMISYRADFNRCGRADFEVMYVTSVWQRRDGRWMNILSQDTPRINA